MSFRDYFVLFTMLALLWFFAPIIWVFWTGAKHGINRVKTIHLFLIVVYYVVFFTQAHKLVPERLKAHQHTEYVCKSETVWR